MSERSDAVLERLELVVREAGRRSAEIEAARSLPRDLIDALIESGVFRLTVPETIGGLGAGLTTALAAVERSAYHDGSTGWCVLSGLVAGLDGGRLPRHHAQTIHGGDAGTMAGGNRAIGGQARQADDGSLVVSGRWGWGSAAAHCAWIGGGVRVVDDEGRPDSLAGGETELFVYFRRDQVVVLDTWYAIGLRGSGSTDYLVTEAVVPEGRWVPLGSTSGDRPSSGLEPGEVLSLGAAAVALGLASRAVDELAALGAMSTEPVGAVLADWVAARLDLAGAEATVRSARTDVRAVAARVDALAGAPIADRLRRDLSSAARHAVERSTESITRCFRAGGPASVLHASPLQRLLRDVEVVVQHPAVSERLMDRVGLQLFEAGECSPPEHPRS